MNREYCLVLPIENMFPGDTYKKGGSLPLHCTLMPWFRLRPDFSGTDLTQALRALPQLDTFLELASGESARFGPNEDVPCYVLKENEPLLRLHNDLLALLQKFEVVFNEPRWIGAGYRPHVSNNGTKSFPTGRQKLVGEFLVVERDENKDKLVRYLQPLVRVRV